MGLLDRIKNLFNKNKKQELNSGEEKSHILSFYSNSSNSNIDIRFAEELVNINGKLLQGVSITYVDQISDGNAHMLSHKYYLEPYITQDNLGNQFNSTQQYYENLKNEQFSLFKGVCVKF